MPKPIQVFEHQKLKVNKEIGFSDKHLQSLIIFNENNSSKYFDVIHNGVQFKQYVGIIKIGKVTIEILPKPDKENRDLQAQKKKWQRVLIKMLDVCQKIQIDKVSESLLQKRFNSILDIYFLMFITELENLVQRGLIKKYRRIESNQKSLKGKLLFNKNVQKNLVQKQNFYCESQVYDREHLIHQILYKALLILDNFSLVNLQDRINRLLLEFDGFSNKNISKNDFLKVVLDRKSQPYQKILDISKIIILNYAPDLSLGNDNMLTLLFDMNKLWEEYIYRILQKYKPIGYKVKSQSFQQFWEKKTIRPDIVITNPNNQNFVIDTKWKIISNNKPADEDLKQMFAYNLHWKCKKSMLLYPKSNQNDISGIYHYNNLDNKCKLGFIDIIEDNLLKKGDLIVKDIFSKLEIPLANSK